MKLPHYSNGARFEAALEAIGAPPKNPVARGGRLSRVRAPLNLERGSRTCTRDATERAACDLHREGIERIVARAPGHFHETADENSSRLLCPLERVRTPWPYARPLPLRARPLHAFTPRGLLDGRARPGFGRVEVAAEDSYGDSGRGDRSTQGSTPDAAHRAWKLKGALESDWRGRRHRNVKQ